MPAAITRSAASISGLTLGLLSDQYKARKRSAVDSKTSSWRSPTDPTQKGDSLGEIVQSIWPRTKGSRFMSATTDRAGAGPVMLKTGWK
jgi:hypothetical protein